MGLTLVIYLSSKSKIKSMLMGVLGLLLGTVGMDPVSGEIRFAFGSSHLIDGIDIALIAMGLFGLAEALTLMGGGKGSPEFVKNTNLKDILPSRKDWKDSSRPIVRGSASGFLMGILPGGGAVMASFVSYAMERRFSRHPQKFGTGVIEGVAGPESANNAAAVGAFVPLLTLGIPANVVMALLLGAFMVHGVNPGPQLVETNPALFWGIITSMYIGNFLLLILNVPLIGLFVRILKIPQQVLAPLITVFCLIGAYSLKNDASGGIDRYLVRGNRLLDA